MNKRKTILDFFSKSPKCSADQKKTSENLCDITEKQLKTNGLKQKLSLPEVSKSSLLENTSLKKEKRPISSCTDLEEETEHVQPESPISKPNSKRRRIVVASESDDSDEYHPESAASDSSDSESKESRICRSNPEKKKKKTVKSPQLKKFCSPKASLSAKDITTPKSVSLSTKPSTIRKPSLSKTTSGEQVINESISQECVKEWTHEKLDWLKDNNIRDKTGKLKTDPNYNNQTVFVPDAFKKTLTPGMKQWWDLKSDHYDTVLFFKVGKFYELYHMDAVVGVKELGLTFMKGEFAHSGFPENSFGRFSNALVDKGYKVARIEQTETPQMMEERCKKTVRPTKFDRVVSREICQITTKGTKTLTYQAENIGFVNNYLLAICEKESLEPESPVEYGICFVDTSIGCINVGQFTDDRHGSRLLTLIALNTPVEVLYDKSSISKQTLKLFNSSLCSARIESGSQFWDFQKTLTFMEESGYFKETYTNPVFGFFLDKQNKAPNKDYDLLVKSFGACMRYLKSCCIEDCVLTLQEFKHYLPEDQNYPGGVGNCQSNVVLDGVTLQNLEIVPLNPSDSAEGTLLGTIDYCSTNMGKRVLRQWLCSPSCSPAVATLRLDAIDDLYKRPDLVTKATASLKKLPDLERLLTKIHTYGLSRSEDHPDTRAVFYESTSYNKKKIADFLSALKGLRIASDVFSEFAPYTKNFKSPLLKKMSSFEDSGGTFPILSKMLNYFDKAFDHELAAKQGSIIPRPKVDEQYDTSTAEIEKSTQDLNSFLEKQRKTFSCKVSYVSSGKNRYLLELPDNKKVPRDFEFQGGRKGFKRYYTKEIKELLSKLAASEESRNAALKDITRKMFEELGKKWSDHLKMAILCISWVDVLLGLTLYRQSCSATMCRPVVLDPATVEPFLEIIDGQHPTFLKYFTGDNYIPNSVFIGPKKQEKQIEDINDGGKVILVTGPNMGGKSTLMRQAGSLVILAQLGSYVPAKSMSFTAVDRIFTRVGASDRICKGESTFFGEASETSCILQHATRDSLVLMDELGRGTATYDGTAIACSVLKHLAEDIGCRTLFSTHYHSLVEDFRNHPSVGLGHMACMVENHNDCPALEKITFLYKFVSGACPKSYGFNVALLAGVLKHIVQEGYEKAQEVEFSTRIAKSIRKLLDMNKAVDVARAFCDNLF